VTTEESSAEVTDRGLFDFLGKKKEETKPEETIDSEFEHKVHISEPVVPEVKHEKEEKKHSLLEKLHRSDSSSSSSSEEEGEDGEKRKKKKDKKKTATTAEGEVKTEEEKKGFMDKLKE
ncbi:PREDICTED: dehydrin ERD14-like, partial [Brassica oleracea var. oleracea]